MFTMGTLLASIHQLAAEVSFAQAEQLATTFRQIDGTPWSVRRYRLLSAAPHERVRTLLRDLLDHWEKNEPTISGEAIGLALVSTVHALGEERRRQRVELVWTGPELPETAMRRTEQALVQVIHAAQRSLLIVSFAVYRAETISQALVDAISRGVSLRVCVEAPEPSGQRIGYDTLAALGRQVTEQAAVYIWPQEHRSSDPNGRTGSLHAKCAVADQGLLFVSSANLTGYAMNHNIELGLLVRGGPLPGQVDAYFGKLIDDGVLVRVER